MLLDQKRKALFTGDTLRFDGTNITRGPKHFTWDETKELASIQKIAQLYFDVLLPGHADYCPNNASAKVKAYLQSKNL